MSTNKRRDIYVQNNSQNSKKTGITSKSKVKCLDLSDHLSICMCIYLSLYFCPQTWHWHQHNVIFDHWTRYSVHNRYEDSLCQAIPDDVKVVLPAARTLQISRFLFAFTTFTTNIEIMQVSANFKSWRKCIHSMSFELNVISGWYGVHRSYD